MKIQILTLRNTETNQIIWTQGIEDENTGLEVSIPKNLFSQSDISIIKNDESILCRTLFDNDSDIVSTNEIMAKHLVQESLSNLSFEIIEKEISNISETISNCIFQLNSPNYISSLVVYKKDSGELIFAQGTQSKGEQWHKVSLPVEQLSEYEMKDLITCSTDSKIIDNILFLGEFEAQEHLYFSDTLIIDIVHFGV